MTARVRVRLWPFKVFCQRQYVCAVANVPGNDDVMQLSSFTDLVVNICHVTHGNSPSVMSPTSLYELTLFMQAFLLTWHVFVHKMVYRQNTAMDKFLLDIQNPLAPKKYDYDEIIRSRLC